MMIMIHMLVCKVSFSVRREFSFFFFLIKFNSLDFGLPISSKICIESCKSGRVLYCGRFSGGYTEIAFNIFFFKIMFLYCSKRYGFFLKL